ncbi:MAG: hypothetical protein H0T53_04320 [Herpetosiphonaceae bacterium]|nr:hypothetical protein [Herpetosiphonaceae bacterium]
MPSFPSRRRLLTFLLAPLVAYVLLACGDTTPKTPIPLNHELYGQIAPARIFLIVEENHIRLKAECSRDQHHDSIEFRYRYDDESEGHVIVSPFDARCVPGSIIYESGQQSALPLVQGQSIQIKIIVHYRNGTTLSMDRSYSRGAMNELNAED